MKLIRTLKVTPKEFFDYIETTLMAQSKNATPSFTQKDIKEGLKYTVVDEYQMKTSITLLKYRPLIVYQSKVSNLNDTVILTYQINKNKEGIEVVFEQSIESFTKIKPNSLNAKFQETFYLGRMSDQLFKIEKDIIAIRNGEPFEKPNKRKSIFMK